MADRQARHETELHRLVRDAEGARNDRLAGNEGRDRRKNDQRQAEFLAGEQEERVAHHLDCLFGRQAGNHRALAEIVQQQARHHETEPRQAHRSATKMSHIRIERFGTGHGQNDRAEREERHRPVGDEEHYRIIGVERPQDIGVLNDLVETQTRDRDEIDDHDGGEQRAYLRRAAALQQEQEDQQHQGDRDHQCIEARVDDGQPFHRRENRNRGRDHAVAVEQRGGEHAQQHNQPAVARLADMTAEQRNEGETAALPLVVGAHEDRHILDRHHDQHRPENQAYDAEYVQPVDCDARRSGKGFAERIERAGTDIAEDDTDSPHGQRSARPAMPMPMPFLGGYTFGDRVLRWRGIIHVGLVPTTSCHSACMAKSRALAAWLRTRNTLSKRLISLRFG